MWFYTYQLCIFISSFDNTFSSVLLESLRRRVDWRNISGVDHVDEDLAVSQPLLLFHRWNFKPRLWNQQFPRNFIFAESEDIVSTVWLSLEACLLAGVMCAPLFREHWFQLCRGFCASSGCNVDSLTRLLQPWRCTFTRHRVFAQLHGHFRTVSQIVSVWVLIDGVIHLHMWLFEWSCCCALLLSSVQASDTVSVSSDNERPVQVSKSSRQYLPSGPQALIKWAAEQGYGPVTSYTSTPVANHFNIRLREPGKMKTKREIVLN